MPLPEKQASESSRYFQEQEALYKRILQGEALVYDETVVNFQALALDIHEELPEEVRTPAINLLERGYPSAYVTDRIFEHVNRGSLQSLSYDEMLYRVELFRQFYIQLNPGVTYKSAECFKPRPELVHGPPADPNKFRYERQEGVAVFLEMRKLPPLLLDIVASLLLIGEAPEFVTNLLLRHLDGGIQNHNPMELLYGVELLRRYMQHLNWKWCDEHFGASYDDPSRIRHIRRRFLGSDLLLATDERDFPPTCPAHSFSYQPDQAPELRCDLHLLPDEVEQELTKRLCAGDCAEAVSQWLVEQPSRGRLQDMNERQLLYRLECQRRFLFYGFGDWLSIESKHKDQGKSLRAAGAAVERRRAVLLWDLAQLPQPLFAQFVRVLMEGGEVADRVLRLTARLNREAANAVPGAPPSQPEQKPAKSRSRKKKAAADSEKGFRTQKGDGMVDALLKLEPALFAEVTKLLTCGAEATVVTRFILSHPDLGNFPLRHPNTVRQYVQHLRYLLLAKATPPSGRKRFFHQIAKHLEKQHSHLVSLLLSRQKLSETGDGKPSPALALPEIGTRSQIKASLMELFWGDPTGTLSTLLSLRGEDLPVELA